jgi:UDP-N-acetylmuramate dehydrogenase
VNLSVPPAYVREHEPLARHTTLELGGPARYFAQATDEPTLLDCIRWATERHLPLAVIGGGSNLVVADGGFEGVVLKIALRGLTMHPPQAHGPGGDDVIVSAASGESFDVLVETTVKRGFRGLECLSGIPGLVGATPMQNVGAYGQEVADTIRAVRVLDRVSLRTDVLSAADCRFTYRDSLFKQQRERYVVLGVTFALRAGGECTPRHDQVRQALAVMPRTGEQSMSPARVRQAVLALRRMKSMVVDSTDPNHRSVGSFFVNPVLSLAAAEDVFARAVSRGITAHPDDVPRFPQPGGGTKLSAAWLIEHAGVPPGFRLGAVGVSTKHVLALVNHGGGSTKELLVLAAHVREAVREMFEVCLEPEPAFIGFPDPPLTAGDR